MLSDCHYLLIYSFKVWTGGIWFIGYGCREHREICLITNQRAKATLLFDVAGRSGFHSQTVIHRWSLNDSLSSFVLTMTAFPTASCSTKGNFCSFCCGMKRLWISVVETSAGESAEHIIFRVDDKEWCLQKNLPQICLTFLTIVLGTFPVQ